MALNAPHTWVCLSWGGKGRVESNEVEVGYFERPARLVVFVLGGGGRDRVEPEEVVDVHQTHRHPHTHAHLHTHKHHPHTLRQVLSASSAFLGSSFSRFEKICSPLKYLLAWLMIALQMVRHKITSLMGLL